MQKNISFRTNKKKIKILNHSTFIDIPWFLLTFIVDITKEYCNSRYLMAISFYKIIYTLLLHSEINDKPSSKQNLHIYNR